MIMLKKNNFVAILCIILGSIANAQLVTVNKVHFHVSPGAVIQINGSTRTIDSCFYNLGTVKIQGDYTNDGETYGGDLASDGIFEIQGDWINNKNFTPKLGLVRLTGATQHIGGTKMSTFYDLDLAGSGQKIQAINSRVQHFLSLNNVELATETFTMAILSIDPNAITRGTGFVSSLVGGFLSRNLIMKQDYLFPVGSSVGTTRYSPVTITPYAVPADTSTYTVRMVNNLATTDGYDINVNDDEVCFANPNYYHLIDHIRQNEQAEVIIQYDNIQDTSSWNMIAHWDNSGVPIWKNTGGNFMYKNQPYAGVNFVKIPNGYGNFTPTPFILAYRRPTITDLVCTSELCFGDTAKVYSLNGGTTPGSYVWNITGGTITSNPSLSSIKVNWNIVGTGHVTVYESIFGKCNTLPLTCDVTIHPKPVAAIVSDTNNVFEYDMVHFSDPSNPNCNYTWDFGDGHQNALTDPFHKYSAPGAYKVVHIVETQFGCLDTATYTLNVVKGVIRGNVFTPNGDGYNDEFIIKNSGMGTYSLKIFDRWGGLVFETTGQHIGWDGKTRSGNDAAAGTYYYIFSGAIDNKKYDENGVITLLRDK